MAGHCVDFDELAQTMHCKIRGGLEVGCGLVGLGGRRVFGLSNRFAEHNPDIRVKLELG